LTLLCIPAIFARIADIGITGVRKMPTSLTYDEFLSRFKERSRPLLLALNSDIDQYRLKLKEEIRTQLDEEIDLDTGNLEIELVFKAMARIISLVYSDSV
jgi:hypothetical protein